MADTKFLTFRKFNELATADYLIAVLNHNHIEYEIEDNTINFDPTFVNNELAKEYLVKIKQNDFELVNKLLLEAEKEQLNEVDANHYLLSFTNQELMDVLKNYDEWNEFDVALARKLLNERGEFIDDKAIETIVAERLKFLEQPEQPQTTWIIIGYVVAFLGGVLGVFIGWHLSRHKKTLPNGEQVYAYLYSDRKQGNRIFRISIAVFIGTLVIRFLTRG